MPEVKKQLKLNKIDYYKVHLSLINCILPVRKDYDNEGKMTRKEVEVIAAFMSLEGDIASYRFGKTGKRIIMKQLELSFSGLSNYLISLTKKGFLVRNDLDDLNILPILIPEKDEQYYLLKLIKTDNDGT